MVFIVQKHWTQRQFLRAEKVEVRGFRFALCHAQCHETILTACLDNALLYEIRDPLHNSWRSVSIAQTKQSGTITPKRAVTFEGKGPPSLIFIRDVLFHRINVVCIKPQASCPTHPFNQCTARSFFRKEPNSSVMPSKIIKVTLRFGSPGFEWIVLFPSGAIIGIVRYRVFAPIAYKIQHQCLKHVVTRNKKDDTLCTGRICKITSWRVCSANSERL